MHSICMYVYICLYLIYQVILIVYHKKIILKTDLFIKNISR